MSATLPLEQFRPLRRLGAPDAPDEATLVTRGDEMFLLVEISSGSLAEAWPYAGCEHVWAPLDVVRRTDGHDALMPRAVETLSTFLYRRAGSTMSAGEVVTLACSVLRGLHEVRADAPAGHPAAMATWWITDAGRPVLVMCGDRAADNSSAEALELLCEFATDRELLRALQDAKEACLGRGDVQLDPIESRLCSIAAPQPVMIALVGGGAEGFASVDPVIARRKRQPGGSAADTDTAGRRGGVLLRVRGKVRRILEKLTQRRPVQKNNRPVQKNNTAVQKNNRPVQKNNRAVQDAKGKARDEGASERSHSRLRVVMFAVGLVILVVAIGLLWPQEPKRSAADVVGGVARVSHQPQPQTPGQGEALPESPPAVPEPPTGPGQPPAAPAPPGVTIHTPATDVVGAATAALASARVCQAARTCADVMIDEATAAHVPAEGLVELVDDYGGVAVVRVTPTAGDATLVVIEKRKERWLIREVIRNRG